jgi:hypothetical protein
MSEQGPRAPGSDHGTEHDRARRLTSVTDLAADHPTSAFDRALQWIPRLLSSKPHIIVLILLGCYLIVLPLLGVMVSAKSELIGGNYTNVTSDIGACIAAGGTLHLVNQGRKRQKTEAERLRLLQEVHSLLHHVHAGAGAELGHAMPLSPPGSPGPPNPPGRPSPAGQPDQAG